jgi:acyl carrier protein/SAM-dependent methyltransferase
MRPAIVIEADGAFRVQVGETHHALGRLLREAEGAPGPMNLAAIRDRCPEPLEHEAIYAALAAGGADYGDSYRLLDRVWRGAGEALAELAPPPDEAGWPPALLDALFQLTFALTEGKGGLLPFTIDRIAVAGPLAAATHAYGLRREAGASFVRLDLRMTDADGSVLMAVNGFVARTPIAAASPELPLRLLRPVWSPAPPKPGRMDGDALILGDPARGRALRDAWPDGAARFVETLPEAIDAAQLWFVLDGGGTRAGAGDEAAPVIRLARIVKALAGQVRPPRLTVVTECANSVLPDEIPDPAAAAVAAFAKSVGREHPDFRLRVIDADAATRAAAMLDRAEEPGEIAFRRGVAFTKHLVETRLPEVSAPWRQGGTYLIAGGAGGIGVALAAHLVRRAAARVAILGRRPPDAALTAKIAAIGGEVAYLQADVTDALGLSNAVQDVESRFGAIHGAFHLALAMHDARAVTLDDAAIRAVLAPKAAGTRNLIAALASSRLDFLMLFSSSNAHTTNPGQSAYAAASAAQDAIGRLPAPWPVKVADWGFWGEVGRVATPAYHASLARIGVHPIGTEEGFVTAARILASPFPQIMPLRVTEAVASALGVAPGGLVEAAVAAVAAQALAGAPMLAEATAAFAAIDAYAAGLSLLAFQGLGALAAPGESVGADFAARLGVPPRFARLLAALVDMLGRSGFLLREGDDWRVTGRAEEPEELRRASLARQRADWIANRPEVAPYLDLLDACAARLGDVLRGRVDANDVLFPAGSTALVEPIYRGNPVVDHFQSIVATAAAAAVRERLERLGPAARLRILEIGAGTGGTTAFLLPALAPFADRISFVFTDVGRVFLDAARERFGDYPFLSVEHLDIEQPPAAQGFTVNSFDLVIAANVLHATRDIDVTLAHVRALCREGGLLLVNEATARQDFNTLTFGLTRGWWLFEDAERRIPHAPLLDALAWQAALAGHAFRGVQILAGGEGGLQSVIAATGDGIAVVAAPADPARAAPPRMVGGQARIEAVLRQAVAQSLRLTPEEVEPDTSFADYGADSIISVELVRDINAALGIELKTTALFNYSTVRSLAGYIGTEFADRFGPVAEAAKPASRARVRSERLRDIIRRSRDGMEAKSAGPEPATAPEPDPDPAVDDDAAFLATLQRLQAGTIDLTKALAETGCD